MKEDNESIWRAYRAGDAEACEQLVEKHLPLVKVTVGRIAIHLPSFIDYEELYSTGCMGLLAAINRYDPSREAKFSTYAITRIRGAVIDELRSRDLLGRVTRDRVTKIRKAENELRRKGEVLSPQDIAAEAGVTLHEYYDAVICERASHTVSLSEPVSTDEGSQTLADVLEAKGVTGEHLKLEDEEILAHIEVFLDEREKLLVILYYHDELTLKEIGKIMQISESRISQIHSDMLNKIRKKLKKIGI